jgi:hypothetical protein
MLTMLAFVVCYPIGFPPGTSEISGSDAGWHAIAEAYMHSGGGGQEMEAQ